MRRLTPQPSPPPERFSVLRLFGVFLRVLAVITFLSAVAVAVLNAKLFSTEILGIFGIALALEFAGGLLCVSIDVARDVRRIADRLALRAEDRSHEPT